MKKDTIQYWTILNRAEYWYLTNLSIIFDGDAISITDENCSFFFNGKAKIRLVPNINITHVEYTLLPFKKTRRSSVSNITVRRKNFAKGAVLAAPFANSGYFLPSSGICWKTSRNAPTAPSAPAASYGMKVLVDLPSAIFCNDSR